MSLSVKPVVHTPAVKARVLHLFSQLNQLQNRIQPRLHLEYSQCTLLPWESCFSMLCTYAVELTSNCLEELYFLLF